MSRGYLQKRKLRDGTLCVLCRFSAPGPHGSTILRGETLRQRPGETAHHLEQRARDLLAARRTEVGTRSYVPPAELTLGDLIDRYLATRAGDLSPATIGRYRRAAKLIPRALVSTRIDRIGALDIQAVYGRLLAGGHAPNGIRQVHKLIGGALRQAVAWGILPKSPAIGVKLPAKADASPAVWSEAEVARFLAETVASPWGDLWRLLLLTGMRIGEALALVWSDVDLDRATITVRRTMTDTEDGRYVPGEVAKTARSRRTVALAPSLVACLRARKARATSTVVFAARNGGYTRDSTASHAFARDVERAGVRRIRVHDMRHVCATSMLRKGINPKVVADLLGQSVTTLLATYAHCLPADLSSAVGVWEEAITTATTSAAHRG